VDIKDLLLVKIDGSAVTAFTWTCPTAGSCWEKFHNYYQPKELLNSKWFDLNKNKIKFGTPVYTSQRYQKKYEVLGVEVNI